MQTLGDSLKEEVEVPLKNYSTEISAMKSLGEIQGNLAAHGAVSIMINYNADREPESLSFIVPTKHGKLPFRLPSNVAAVQKVLDLQGAVGRNKPGQAARVAWRIIKDWVAAQMAILETEMVTIEQIFLPYMQTKDGQTLYELMVTRGFYLTEGRG